MKSEYLTHKDGTRFVPITQPDAVIDSEGKSLTTKLAKKQDTLVSGENIKTINGNSILGKGNINIEGGGGEGGKYLIVTMSNVTETSATTDKTSAEVASAMAEGTDVYYTDGAYVYKASLSNSDDVVMFYAIIGSTSVSYVHINKSIEIQTITLAELSALANKVDKVSGKGLSTNDYTTDEKNKLADIDLSKYVSPLVLEFDDDDKIITPLNDIARSGRPISFGDDKLYFVGKVVGGSTVTSVTLFSYKYDIASEGDSTQYMLCDTVIINNDGTYNWETIKLAKKEDVDNYIGKLNKIYYEITNDYNNSTSYVVDDYCRYNDVLYKCIAANKGNWDESCWEKVDNICQDITNLSLKVSTLETDKTDILSVLDEVIADDTTLTSINELLDDING